MKLAFGRGEDEWGWLSGYPELELKKIPAEEQER